MYADRHDRSRLDPRSLAIAVAINGGVIAALLLASPVLRIIRHPNTITLYPVAAPPPVDPPPPLAPDQPRASHQPISTPRAAVETPSAATVETTTTLLPLALPAADPGPPVAPPIPAPPPAPALVGAEVDPAHRGDLQPAYPDSELRAEREGVVTVRVLVGTDGRVHDVVGEAATSDAFLRATRDQALRHWRFRPATRGGVPVESWRVMTIRFVIPR